MALSNLTFDDEPYRERLGSSGFGVASGTVESSAAMDNADYLALIALLAGHFKTTPRVMVVPGAPGVLTGTTYAFIATGRVV
jgi:hypothetical protein